MYIADTKQEFRFFSREKVLVKKKLSHFLFYTSIHFIVYIVFNFFNLDFHCLQRACIPQESLVHQQHHDRLTLLLVTVTDILQPSNFKKR